MERLQGRMAAEHINLPVFVALTTAAPSYQMKPGDNVVVATSAAADDAGILILPSLAEALGQFYHISAPTGAAGGDISVVDHESATEITTYGDMDADGDNAIFFAAPTGWITVYDGVA